MERERRHRTLRILIGITVMIILAGAPFVILSHYAGGWGVPYFKFTTDRGTTCTNDFTGYHCNRVTLADIRWWGDVPLPTGTKVISSYYKSTSNFRLDAVVEVPPAEQKITTERLRREFGNCIPDHPTQLDTTGLKGVCVQANDASDPIDSSTPMADTLYEITTGLRDTGVMVVGIHEQSR